MSFMMNPLIEWAWYNVILIESSSHPLLEFETQPYSDCPSSQSGHEVSEVATSEEEQKGSAAI